MDIPENEKKLISWLGLNIVIILDDNTEVKGKLYYFNNFYLIVHLENNNYKLINSNRIQFIDYKTNNWIYQINERLLDLKTTEEFYQIERDKSNFIKNNKNFILYLKHNNNDIFKILKDDYKNIYFEGSNIIIPELELRIKFPFSKNSILCLNNNSKEVIYNKLKKFIHN